MHLTPGDQERLMLALAGMVARDRQARGVKLNYPEAVALLTTWVIERAREGVSVAELMQLGREVLGPDDVMHGVADMLTDVQVEAMFPDGRKLVTFHHPIAATGAAEGPGAVRVRPGTVELNADRSPAERIELTDHQHRRPAGADRLASSPARRELRSRLRPRQGVRFPAGHPVRHLAPVRTGSLAHRAGGHHPRTAASPRPAVGQDRRRRPRSAPLVRHHHR